MKVCHVNFLKPYFACDVSADVVTGFPVMATASAVEDDMSGEVLLQPWLKNSESLAKLGSLLGHVKGNRVNYSIL